MRPNKKNYLKNVQLDEVSLVDVPANPKARAVLVKRANPMTKSMDSMKTDMENLTDEQRRQFQDLINEGWDEEEALDKVCGRMMKSTEGEQGMDIEELQAKLAELEADSKLFEKRAEAAEAAVAVLSKAFEDNGFEVAKSEEGDYTVAKRAEEEMIEFEGEQIAKSAIPEPILKRLETQAAELAAVKKAQEQEAFAKRAEETFPNLAGSRENKAALLKALEMIDGDEDRAAVEKALKAADAAVSKMFKETGEMASTEDTSAAARLDKMVEAYMVEKGVARETAFAQVTKSGDGKKLMIEARNTAN